MIWDEARTGEVRGVGERSHQREQWGARCGWPAGPSREARWCGPTKGRLATRDAKCGSNELGRTQNCAVSVCLLLRLGRLFTLEFSRVQKKRTAQRGGVLSSNLRAAEARKAVLQFLYLRKRNRTFIVLLGCRYSDKSTRPAFFVVWWCFSLSEPQPPNLRQSGNCILILDSVFGKFAFHSHPPSRNFVHRGIQYERTDRRSHRGGLQVHNAVKDTTTAEGATTRRRQSRQEQHADSARATCRQQQQQQQRRTSL